MTSDTVHFPRCQSAQVCRHRQNPTGDNRFHCRDCYCLFQLTYAYEARRSRVKAPITEIAFNGAGVRDTARILKVGINTVIQTLKNSRHDGNVISGGPC